MRTPGIASTDVHKNLPMIRFLLLILRLLLKSSADALTAQLASGSGFRARRGY